jgi:hypothetical protein
METGVWPAGPSPVCIQPSPTPTQAIFSGRAPHFMLSLASVTFFPGGL